METASYNFPVFGFFFSVTFGSINNVIDNAFQEVSGLNVKQQTEEIKVGGINNRVYKVPTRISYENLVLKRGHVKSKTELTDWVDKQLLYNKKTYITPREIQVKLLDLKNKNPLMVWYFEGAYPVAWNVSGIDAKNGQILVETLEFSYSYMFRQIVGKTK